MANPEHLALVRQGVDTWNKWKQIHPTIDDWIAEDLTYICERPGSRFATFGPDLKAADLSGLILTTADFEAANLEMSTLRKTGLERSDLHYANMRGAQAQGVMFSGAYMAHVNTDGADLSSASMRGADIRKGSFRGTSLLDADLSNANLFAADFSGADLRGAKLSAAYLKEANFSGADLRGADLYEANLRKAILTGAQLTNVNLQEARLRGAKIDQCFVDGCDLSYAQIIDVDFSSSSLMNCNIYGVAAWDNKIAGLQQRDLLITSSEGVTITVDDLELASFLYLLLDNNRLRSVLDTLTARTALILGRFTPTRKAILDTIRSRLAAAGYIPIIFDFTKPANRNYTETVTTLARLSRCVIADVTDPMVVIQELFAIVPHLPSVPVLPILEAGSTQNVVLSDLSVYPWVRPVERYTVEHDAAEIATRFLQSMTPSRSLKDEMRASK